jgi:predicted dehydrogenase
VEPVRWGIIGTGRIAETFASDLTQVTEGTVAAVGSRTLATAEAFARRHGAARAYGSYADLVADPDVDAVYVATPHPMHRDNALAALEAGKPVLVEKSFTMNAAEAREVVAAARRTGLFAMEAMWTRFLPHVAALREVLASGELGDLVLVQADHGKWFSRDATSRLFAPELGGSALLDLGIYPISFASMVLGRPSTIAALVEPTFTGVDGLASMVFGYESGAQALLTCTSSARSATRASIVGTEARVEIEGDFYAPTVFSVIQRDGTTRRYSFDVTGRGLHFEAVEVARCLAEGELESPLMPLDETIEIMETMDAVLAAPSLPHGT